MRRILLACLCLTYIACGEEPTETSDPVIRPVRAERVTATGAKRTRTFSGSARAGQESRLSFRINGSIKQLKVKLGDRVRKDQVIARLDPKDYQLQVQQAEAALAQSRAQERNAKANYERIRGLYENNSASVNELDSSRAAMESADAQVNNLSKQLELARSQLSYTDLKAPLDGLIADVISEVNENVAAGQAIAILNAGSRLEITFQAPEALISDIQEGESATIAFDALPGQQFGASITEVGVATGNIATAFPITATLNEANDDVRQGMAAEVTMTFGNEGNRDQIFVKPKAVVEDQEGRFVYIAEASDGDLATVKRREVRTGSLTEEGIEILEGLQDGDMIITAGLRFLNDGLQVRLPGGAEE